MHIVVAGSLRRDSGSSAPAPDLEPEMGGLLHELFRGEDKPAFEGLLSSEPLAQAPKPLVGHVASRRTKPDPAGPSAFKSPASTSASTRRSSSAAAARSRSPMN